LKTSFSLFLALRYLKPKRTFVSIITLISVLGVTLGITVLILVISVMTGFDEELRDKVLGFDAHIIVTNEDMADGVIQDWRGLVKEIDATPGVVAAAPYVQGPVIVEFEHRRLAPLIRGINMDDQEKVTPLKNLIIAGSAVLRGDSAIIGSEIARSLGIGVGDKLTVYSPGNISDVSALIDDLEKHPNDPKRLADLKGLVSPNDLTVTGIFESGRFIYDSEFVLVPLHIAQELYAMEDDVHGITVKTVDPYQAEAVKNRMAAFLQPPLAASTWIDENKQLFDAIRTERNVMFFLLLFIVIVAAFGIMNTLITVTVQKTREIGIMKALGATTPQIIWVFLSQGMIVGFFGNASGLALGMLLIRYRNEFREWLGRVLHVHIFPAEIYQFSAIPAKVVPHDVAIICLSAFAICSLAALLPAYVASRLDPVEALRYE